MLISFFNPSNLIGCGGDINQSEEGYMEGVCRGGMWRGYMEGICGGGTQRGMQRGQQRGYMEGVCGGGMWRGYVEGVYGGDMQMGVQRWLPLATINLVGDNREFEV